ncbi:armadillo-type protein [Mycena filopes]|nr:armadillo-type protein [Mycena filopes]
MMVFEPSTVLTQFMEHRNSPDPQVRAFICAVLTDLAVHRSPVLVELSFEPMRQMSTLLSDDNTEVRQTVLHAFSKFSGWAAAAQAFDVQIVQAILNTSVELEGTKSVSSTDIQRWWCRAMGDLAIYNFDSIYPVLLKICLHMLPFLSDTDIGVVHGALRAICNISRSTCGTAILAQIGIWGNLGKLLGKSNSRVWQSTCRILGNLAARGAVCPSAFALVHVRAQVICLLLTGKSVDPVPDTSQFWLELHLKGDVDRKIQREATYALSKMTCWSEDTMQTVADTQLLGQIPYLLVSSDTEVRQWVCEILGRLLSDALQSRRLPNFDMEYYLRHAVILLSDPAEKVRKVAINILSPRASWFAGPTIVEHVAKYSNSSDRRIRCLVCKMLEATSPASLCEPKPYLVLLPLLLDQDVEVGDLALRAVSTLSRSSDGAQALVDTDIVKHLSKLVDIGRSRPLACEILGNLGFYQVLPHLDGALRTRLTDLLRDNDCDVRESAFMALLWCNHYVLP